MSEIKKINGIGLCDAAARQGLQACVKSVNGTAPDESGNVQVSDLLIVTIDDDDVVSHTTAEIKDHVQAGGVVMLRTPADGDWPLCHICDNFVDFAYVNTEEHIISGYYFFNDGGVDFFSDTWASYSFADGKIAAPSTAKMGQTIVVTAVNSQGYPTQWEAVDRQVITAKFWDNGQGKYACEAETITAVEMINAILAGSIVQAQFYDKLGELAFTAIGTIKGPNESDSAQNELWFAYGLGKFMHNPLHSDYFLDGNINNKTSGNEVWIPQ